MNTNENALVGWRAIAEMFNVSPRTMQRKRQELKAVRIDI